MTAHENENRDLLTTDQRSELDPPNRRHLDWEGGALSMDTLLQFHPPSPPYSERTRIEHGLLFSNQAYSSISWSIFSDQERKGAKIKRCLGKRIYPAL